VNVVAVTGEADWVWQGMWRGVVGDGACHGGKVERGGWAAAWRGEAVTTRGGVRIFL
jgi:hypothetical protein